MNLALLFMNLVRSNFFKISITIGEYNFLNVVTGAIIGKESRFDIPGVTSCQEHHHLQLQLDSASVVSLSVPKL